MTVPLCEIKVNKCVFQPFKNASIDCLGCVCTCPVLANSPQVRVVSSHRAPRTGWALFGRDVSSLTTPQQTVAFLPLIVHHLSPPPPILLTTTSPFFYLLRNAAIKREDPAF